MPPLRLADLPWTEVDALDRYRTVPILPVGAVEAHGPHLPLGTDAILAEAMAEAGAERLAGRDLIPLLLPTVAYSPAPFAAAFAGTVGIDPAALTAALVGIARSLAHHGFGSLAFANAHLDPAHLAALHEAEQAILREELLIAVFPDLTRKPWAGRLGEEFRSGACHAGRFEGSVVLARRPELVRRELAAALPPNPASLSRAIREGRRSFAEAGGSRAYFGDPAAATAEEGRATIETLGEILADAVLAAHKPPSS
jgi:creatinine amidohydrolase